MTNKDDIILYSAVSPEAVDSVMKIGLLSGDRLYQDKKLLKKARPDPSERKKWIKKYEEMRYMSMSFRGPSCFFTLTDESKINKNHPITVGNLQMLKINFSSMEKKCLMKSILEGKGSYLLTK